MIDFSLALLKSIIPKKKLSLRSLIKADINFWNEDIYETNTNLDEQFEKLMKEVSVLSTEIHECSLGKESREVSVSIAGYVSKQINERVKYDLCKKYLICDSAEVNDEDDHDYLNLLSRGGLTIPGKYIAEFVSHSFAILDLVENIISKHPSISVRKAAVSILNEYLDGCISCDSHHNKVKNLALNCIVNIFYNNKQKKDADVPRKDSIVAFKRRQRSFDNQ